MLCKFHSLRHLLFNFSDFFFWFARILVDCSHSHLFFIWCKSSWLLVINSTSSRISSSAPCVCFLGFLKEIGGCWLYVPTLQMSGLNWMGCWVCILSPALLATVGFELSAVSRWSRRQYHGSYPSCLFSTGILEWPHSVWGSLCLWCQQSSWRCFMFKFPLIWKWKADPSDSNSESGAGEAAPAAVHIQPVGLTMLP